MKCTIHTYLLNELYSQEYADKFHNGNPSSDNRAFEWEDELQISSAISNLVELRNEVYYLQGTLPEGKPFSYPVSNMRIVQIESNEAPTILVGCSESILHELRIQKNKKEAVIEIFIKDNEPLSNPIPGIYIGSKSFPKELIF